MPDERSCSEVLQSVSEGMAVCCAITCVPLELAGKARKAGCSAVARGAGREPGGRMVAEVAGSWTRVVRGADDMASNSCDHL